MLRRIEAVPASRMNILIIGEAGAGKTSCIRTICGQDFQNGRWVPVFGVEPEKVCVLSAESGLLCISDLIAEGKVSGYEISSFADFLEALRTVQSEEFKAEGCRWIFIDSLSEISSRCAEQMQETYPDKNDTFKMWGEYNTRMTDIIKAFRDLKDYNVVFTCLKTSSGGQSGGRATQSPDIAGAALKSRLASFFDEVLHMDKTVMPDGNVQVMFQTQFPAGLAKDRSGRLAPAERPNLLYIQHKILGASQKEKKCS